MALVQSPLVQSKFAFSQLEIKLVQCDSKITPKVHKCIKVILIKNDYL
jgi:hypothetical protein